jgi:RND family efflux transporter MFP subunit
MSNIYSTFKKNRLVIIFCATVLLIAVLAVSPRLKTPVSGDETGQSKTAVSLIPVKDYLDKKTIILDNGTVESVNQADLRSQFSAPAASVNVSLGDAVSTGQILVSMKNNDILAQLDQAKAGLAGARASLAASEKGARTEDIRLSETQLNQAKMALAVSIQNAYAESDDAIRNHVNKFFINPAGKSPEFLINVDAGTNSMQFGAIGSDASQKIGIKKVELEKRLNDWRDQINTLDSSSNPQPYLSAAKDNLNFIIDFMNDLSVLVNSLTTDNATIAYKPALDGYKSELAGARSTIAGTQTSLLGAETSWKVASESLELKTAGATSEQLDQQKAQVAQAEASVAALEAQVEKTYVRAPIAGKISYLDARIGQLISGGQLVASIVNPDALQVKTYASENDFMNIAVNDPVLVDEFVSGKVYKISPAIDPNAKKVEIIVLITQNSVDHPIVVGQTVTLSIQSAAASGAEPIYLLPIQAVKTNGQSYLFSVDQNDAVYEIPVRTGSLAGEKIEVTGNIDPGLNIIDSAMSLAPGQKVSVSR